MSIMLGCKIKISFCLIMRCTYFSLILIALPSVLAVPLEVPAGQLVGVQARVDASLPEPAGGVVANAPVHRRLLEAVPPPASYATDNLPVQRRLVPDLPPPVGTVADMLPVQRRIVSDLPEPVEDIVEMTPAAVVVDALPRDLPEEGADFNLLQSSAHAYPQAVQNTANYKASEVPNENASAQSPGADTGDLPVSSSVTDDDNDSRDSTDDISDDSSNIDEDNDNNDDGDFDNDDDA